MKPKNPGNGHWPWAQKNDDNESYFIIVRLTKRLSGAESLPSPKHKPLVGVSRCLLGDAVRYDGKSRANSMVLENLSRLFDFVPVCPEVEAGLSVPRPPVQLSGSLEKPRVTGRNEPTLDVTDILYDYCERKPAELKNLTGFIFKSRSPSCGLNSTPVFINNENISETSRGVFAKIMCESYPGLVVIEDSELENPNALDRFIQAVLMAQPS